MRDSVGDDRETDEDDTGLVEERLIARHYPPLPASAYLPSSTLGGWLQQPVRWFDEWPLSRYVLCCLHLLIAVAPTVSLLIVNAYYFHSFTLSTSNPSDLVVSLIHSDLHTDTVQGDGTIDIDLLFLVPSNASSSHLPNCGLDADSHLKGICYSVAANTTGLLHYTDCAAIIEVDTLEGTDIRQSAPPAEVNLYGSPCRPLPQGHPDMRTFNPYTVRCDLPHWVLARNADQAPPPQPLPLPTSPTSPPQPTSALPPLQPSEQILRVIFQTHARSTFLPPMQYWAMRTWIDRNPDYRYMFYDDEDVARFIEGYWHPLLSNAQLDDIREAASLLRRHMPMAASADLLRYMLILKYGGVYVDTDTACIDALSTWIDYEQDSFIVQSNMDLQWIIIAAPDHPVILDTLLTAVHNVLHPLKAELSISPVYETTGPPVLLGAIARYNATVLANPSLRPIRIVSSNPADYDTQTLTLYGRTFNYFQFSNHLLLKACEVEWEQRLYEHVPWVYKQRVIIATYFYRRLAVWNGVTVLLCVGSAVVWWAAFRGRWLHKSAFTYWSIGVALLQVGVLVHELPV